MRRSSICQGWGVREAVAITSTEQGARGDHFDTLLSVQLNSPNIGLLATCIVALGLSLYAWHRERKSVKSSPSTRAKLFRYALLLSIVSPTVCGLLLSVPMIVSLGDKAFEMVECLGMICSLSAILLGFAGTGSKGPLVVASGGLSGTVWFMCFAMFMIRYM